MSRRRTLTIVAVSIGVLVVLTLIVKSWVSRKFTAMAETGRVVIEQGQEFGRGVTIQQCVTAGLVRSDSTGGGISARIDNGLWVGGCAETASGRDELCATVPASGILATTRWIAGYCQSIGRAGSPCTELVQQVANSCQRRRPDPPPS